MKILMLGLTKRSESCLKQLAQLHNGAYADLMPLMILMVF